MRRRRVIFGGSDPTAAQTRQRRFRVGSLLDLRYLAVRKEAQFGHLLPIRCLQSCLACSKEITSPENDRTGERGLPCISTWADGLGATPANVATVGIEWMSDSRLQMVHSSQGSFGVANKSECIFSDLSNSRVYELRPLDKCRIPSGLPQTSLRRTPLTCFLATLYLRYARRPFVVKAPRNIVIIYGSAMPGRVLASA